MADNRWSTNVAILLAMLLGPPILVAYDGRLDDYFPKTGEALFIYLAVNMLLGAAVLGLLALFRDYLMIARDKRLRNTITRAFTRTSIDASKLTVEVADGSVTIKGTVPRYEMLESVRWLLTDRGFDRGPVRCEIDVEAVAPDGGTSAASAPESRPAGGMPPVIEQKRDELRQHAFRHHLRFLSRYG